MKRHFLSRRCCRWLAAAAVMAALRPAGCSDNSVPAKPAAKASDAARHPAPAPLPVEPATSRPASSSAASSPSPKPPPESPPPAKPPEQPTPPLTPASERPINLYSGVATPQATVDGTAMGFSVDYELVTGATEPGDYVWVIERTHGDPQKEQVKLKDRGSLSVVLVGWRPEHGPFRSHIENTKGKRLTESIDMIGGG